MYRADSVGKAQRDMLSFMELLVFFCGEAAPADFGARFGIRPAAATRDFLTYRTRAPENFIYDISAKFYMPATRFRLVFGFDSGRVLSWLIQGDGDRLAGRTRRPIPGETHGLLSAPPLETLTVITRAIHQSRSISIFYWSVSSGESRRVIVPFALVNSGLRWHVRAYHRMRSRFGDFVVTRIMAPRTLDEIPGEHERSVVDHQWNCVVDQELVPHPGLRHPVTVDADYQLSGGVLKQSLRAAVAGYALHRWQMDCSADHRLDAVAYRLWLRNTPTLYGVERAVMAPGHRMAAQQ